MKKKSLAKKIVKIFFIIFLVFSLLNSCSPLNSKAFDVGDVLDLNSVAGQIVQNTRYIPDRLKDILRVTSNSLGIGSDWGSGFSRGSGLDSGFFSLKEMSDIQLANNNNSDIYTYPFYSFYGKAKVQYTNVNSNPNDVDYIDINEMYFCTCTTRSYMDGSYPSNLHYCVPSDFRFGSGIPQIGTLFIKRSNINKNTGEVLSIINYALVPEDYMPYVTYSNNGDIILNFSGKHKLYTDGSLYQYYIDFPTATLTIKNSSTNSSIVNNTISFYPTSSSNYFSFQSNWSLWYCTDVITNNSNFYNDYNIIINNNFGSTPNAKPPISFVGVPSGTIINQNNVNNYNYISYEGGTYDFDTYKFGVDFDTNFQPQIDFDFDNIYKNQPLPGVSFDNDIIYNYLDFLSVPLSSDYLPSEWLDNYASLDTHPNIDIDDFLSVPTETFDANLIQDMGVVTSSGMDLLDVFGLASPFLALALLGVLFKFFD